MPVVIARHPRARRYVLRLTAGGGLRLTVPRGASIEGGLRFVSRQTAWIARERTRRAAVASAWSASTEIWWRGTRTTPAWTSEGVWLGDDIMPAGAGSGEAAGAPHAVFPAWARSIAERELTARCLELAAGCDEPIARVRVGNQRSRWGSCSPRRVIALNWRLIQAPASVSDYVILHELMHLRQPNHSRRFWREVDAVCPGWRDAERWLRRFGREIL
jgi:predicted metal-dependent hydrolase